MSLKKISPVYMNKFRFVLDNVPRAHAHDVALDIGCGFGEYMNLLEKKGYHVTGIDIDKEAIKHNKHALYQSAEKLTFTNNSFDVVTCVDVLEHVDNPQYVMSEIRRVVKEDGTVIITVPHFDFPFTYDPINFILKFFGTHIKIGLWWWGHKRLYKVKEIRKLLTEHGFDIVIFEQRTHFLVALFVNYIPYIADRFFVSKKSYKKKKVSLLFKVASRVYSFINSIDGLLKNFNGTHICIVAKKKS